MRFLAWVAPLAIVLLACVGDSPKLPDTQCDGMDTYCNGACSNTQTDPRNCGGCGKSCNAQAGEVCQKGACGPACSGGTSRCGNACVDVQNDPQNCGDCAKACAKGEACVMGKCTLECRMGLTSCSRTTAPPMDAGASDASGDAAVEGGGGGSTSANACVDLQSDPANCGKCGMQCPVDKAYCEAGQCKIFKFVGILTNVDQNDLASPWTECFSEQYNLSGTTVYPGGIVAQKCPQPNLLVGCRQTNTKTLLVAANAPRTDVFFDVGAGTAATHIANGVAWYYPQPSGGNSFSSMGFAPPAEGVTRFSCDVTDGLSPDKRLCWHMSGVTLQSGWRCGTNKGIASGWDRVVFGAP